MTFERDDAIALLRFVAAVGDVFDGAPASDLEPLALVAGGIALPVARELQRELGDPELLDELAVIVSGFDQLMASAAGADRVDGGEA